MHSQTFILTTAFFTLLGALTVFAHPPKPPRCHHDNLLRCLLHYPDLAEPFCNAHVYQGTVTSMVEAIAVQPLTMKETTTSASLHDRKRHNRYPKCLAKVYKPRDLTSACSCFNPTRPTVYSTVSAATSSLPAAIIETTIGYAVTTTPITTLLESIASAEFSVPQDSTACPSPSNTVFITITEFATFAQITSSLSVASYPNILLNDTITTEAQSTFSVSSSVKQSTQSAPILTSSLEQVESSVLTASQPLPSSFTFTNSSAYSQAVVSSTEAIESIYPSQSPASANLTDTTIISSAQKSRTPDLFSPTTSVEAASSISSQTRPKPGTIEIFPITTSQEAISAISSVSMPSSSQISSTSDIQPLPVSTSTTQAPSVTRADQDASTSVLSSKSTTTIIGSLFSSLSSSVRQEATSLSSSSVSKDSTILSSRDFATPSTFTALSSIQTFISPDSALILSSTTPLSSLFYTTASTSTADSLSQPSIASSTNTKIPMLLSTPSSASPMSIPTTSTQIFIAASTSTPEDTPIKSTVASLNSSKSSSITDTLDSTTSSPLSSTRSIINLSSSTSPLTFVETPTVSSQYPSSSTPLSSPNFLFSSSSMAISSKNSSGTAVSFHEPSIWTSTPTPIATPTPTSNQINYLSSISFLSSSIPTILPPSSTSEPPITALTPSSESSIPASISGPTPQTQLSEPQPSSSPPTTISSFLSLTPTPTASSSSETQFISTPDNPISITTSPSNSPSFETSAALLTQTTTFPVSLSISALSQSTTTPSSSTQSRIQSSIQPPFSTNFFTTLLTGGPSVAISIPTLISSPSPLSIAVSPLSTAILVSNPFSLSESASLSLSKSTATTTSTATATSTAISGINSSVGVGASTTTMIGGEAVATTSL